MRAGADSATLTTMAWWCACVRGFDADNVDAWCDDDRQGVCPAVVKGRCHTRSRNNRHLVWGRVCVSKNALRYLFIICVFSYSPPPSPNFLKAASIAIPEDRVFGLGSGRKGVVLGKIMVGEQSWGQHAPGQARCVFMEDRLDTLFEVKRKLKEHSTYMLTKS